MSIYSRDLSIPVSGGFMKNSQHVTNIRFTSNVLRVPSQPSESCRQPKTPTSHFCTMKIILAILLSVFLSGFMTAHGTLVTWQAGNLLIMSNADVQIQYNLTSGTSAFYWQNSKKISSFYAAFQIPSGYFTGNSGSYSNRTYAIDGDQVTVTSVNGSGPTINQYFIFDENDSFLTRLDLTASTPISVNWMSPLVVSTTGGVDLGITNDNRALVVPFDNDANARYNAESMNNSGTGYEVGAFYDNTSRNGLVVGSVTHDTWKSGVYFSGSNNKLNALHVNGGQMSPYDLEPQGWLSGTTVSSPTVFVGFGTDWRTVMETYANENAIQAPEMAWSEGAPFGWNSWYAYTTSINYSDATNAATFIKDNLMNGSFTNAAGTVYVNLDSYWSNLSGSQLAGFTALCHTNGEKAGIYWTPFVWWGTAAEGSNTLIDGDTNYFYSDAYLRTTNGQPQAVDGGIALDPTHPGTQAQIANYIWYFNSLGFDYIKLDFLSHGALEGVHYDTNVVTGIEALNEGMADITNQNTYYGNWYNGHPMFLSEAISPIFPYQYAQSRRIACDASTTAAYTMNSVTYGWWINGRLYQCNDPDCMKFSSTGVTADENQARLINCAIAGTVFLNSDQLGTSSTADTLAITNLTKAAINAVARSGVSFRPVEGNTGTNACNIFTGQIGATWYFAVLNYTSKKATYTVNFSRAGIPPGSYTVTDLYSGVPTYGVSGSMNVTVNTNGGRLFELQ
jgi:alpha-galactosidase